MYSLMTFRKRYISIYRILLRTICERHQNTYAATLNRHDWSSDFPYSNLQVRRRLGSLLGVRECFPESHRHQIEYHSVGMEWVKLSLHALSNSTGPDFVTYLYLQILGSSFQGGVFGLDMPGADVGGFSWPCK